MLGGGGIATAFISVLKLIFFRKQRDSTTAKIDADAESTRADTAIRLSNQLGVLHDRMNLMEANVDTHQRGTAETIRFYRGQIEWFEQLDLAYRKRFHAVNSELGRLGMELRRVEGYYADLLAGSEATLPPPVAIKTFEEIVKAYPLPKAPE